MGYLSYIVSKLKIMFVVYKLVNSKNEIEYIGHTSDIKKRMSNHFDKTGLFHNRKDISYEIVKSGFRKKERAIDYECKLQKKLGFETDREKYSRNMKEVQKKTTEQKSISIIGYDLSGNEIGRFLSAYHASRKLDIYPSLIWNVVNGHQKSTKGFVFKSLENT
jgi:predicted GIY-YIG superfamily endonuclease